MHQWAEHLLFKPEDLMDAMAQSVSSVLWRWDVRTGGRQAWHMQTWAGDPLSRWKQGLTRICPLMSLHNHDTWTKAYKHKESWTKTKAERPSVELREGLDRVPERRTILPWPRWIINSIDNPVFYHMLENWEKYLSEVGHGGTYLYPKVLEVR